MQQKSKEFVKKLYEILENSEYTDYIIWSESGTSFYIINPNEFSKHVLKHLFRHNNINSFIRQLNKYDFHKLKNSASTISKYGPQVLEYEHIYFQKNNKNQLYKIKRKKSGNDDSLILSELMPGMENSFVFQNHVVSTIKNLSDKFQMLIDSVTEIKTDLRELAVEAENKNINALIYDEDINMAMHVYSLLKEHKVSITIVDNNNNLYAIIKQGLFNFLIISASLDMVRDVLRFLRSFDLSTPIIYIGYENIKFDIYTLGITDFLKKPFTYTEFFHIMQKYLPINKKL